MTEEEKAENRKKAGERVSEVVAEIHNLILDRTQDYGGRSRWLIYGRIINILFQSHYQLSLAKAENTLEEVERNETASTAGNT